MGNRVWIIFAMMGAVVRCRSVNNVHINLRRPATQLEQAARSAPDDFDAQWHAAEALADVAENGATKDKRIQAAKSGLTFARRGEELQPNRVEGYYWYAINVGLLADADRMYGLKAVAEIEAALQRAATIDEKYDFAGPLRVLGILHLRTPPPPASIGSPRKGLRLLQLAADLFPNYLENQLYLAEALRDNDRNAEACACVEKVLAAKPAPGHETELARWQASAERLLTCKPTK